jgi:hypothetical protein
MVMAMNLKVKQALFGLVLISTASLPFIFQNCDGTRSRSIDYSVSLATVEKQLNDFATDASAKNQTSDSLAAKNALSIHSKEGSTLYYGTSAGMGKSSEEFDFGSFKNSSDVNPPSNLIVWIALNHIAESDAWEISFVMSGNSGSNTPADSVTTTTLPSALVTPDPNVAVANRKVSLGKIKDTTPLTGAGSTDLTTASPTATPALNAIPASGATETFDLFGFTGGVVNSTDNSSGNIQAQATGATVTDEKFEIPLTIGGVAGILSSTDVYNGDLVDGPVQFKWCSIDSSGSCIEIATFNMIVPELN